MCLLFARKFLLTLLCAIHKQQPSPSTQRELNSSSIEPSSKRGGRNQLWHRFRWPARVAKVAFLQVSGKGFDTGHPVGDVPG
jgi:hypothetical protein